MQTNLSNVIYLDIIYMLKPLKKRIEEAKSFTIQKIKNTITHQKVLEYFK